MSTTHKQKKRRGGSSAKRSAGGFPDKQRVTLVYMDHITRAGAATIGSDYVYSGNGCFDPDITGTGLQPVNFDDWSAIYGRYRVYGSSISVYLTTPGSATGTGQMMFCLAPRHTTTGVTSIFNWLSASSQMYAKHVLFSSASSSSRGTNCHLSSSISTKTILGYKTSAIDDDDTLQALTSANPTHQFYWHLMLGMTDQTSTGTCYMTVRIEYDVEFFDRLDTLLDLARSLKENGGVRTETKESKSESKPGGVDGNISPVLVYADDLLSLEMEKASDTTSTSKSCEDTLNRAKSTFAIPRVWKTRADSVSSVGRPPVSTSRSQMPLPPGARRAPGEPNPPL